MDVLTTFKFKYRSLFIAAFIFLHVPLQGGWTPAQVVSDPAVDVSTRGGAVLGVNSVGNVIAVWTDRGSSTFPTQPAISSSFYTQGIGWSVPQIISSLALNPFDKPLYTAQGDPDVAINDSNYAVAAWEGEYDTGDFPQVIIAAIRSVNGIWNPVTNISSLDSNNFAFNVNVALNEAGTAIAAWREQDLDASLDYTAVSFLPFAGAWSAPFRISTAEASLGDTGSNKPCVQINTSGNAVVTWLRRFNDLTFGIDAATYNATTTSWSAPVTLTSGIASESDLSESPRCAIDPNGNAVAVWIENATVKAAYFNGSIWTAAVNIGTNANSLMDPMVVMDTAGNATATWTSLSNEIVSSTLLSSGVWTTPVVVSTNGAATPFMSQETLAVDLSGNLITIWQDTVSGDVMSSIKLFSGSWQAPEIVFSSGDNDFISVGLASCGFAAALWQNRPDLGSITEVMSSFNGNIFTPQSAEGEYCCDRFAAQKRCMNILTWQPLGCTQYYKIYRNGQLIGTVLANAPLEFIDPLKCKKARYVYTISSVSTLGFESSQVTVHFR